MSLKHFFYNILFFITSCSVMAQGIDSVTVNIEFYKKIKLSDGVSLSANIYKPNSKKKKFSTILIITPYVSDEGQERGMFFAKNGYVFITVDCRGRGNSEGEFFPFRDDAKDGKQIVDWIGEQSWSNGKVGMLGGSYRGMNQWLTLKEFPRNLKTIIPIASVGPGLDFPKYNNIFYPYVMRWLMMTSGKTMNTKLFGSDFWVRKQEQLYKENIPFNAYDSLIGYPKKVFQKWISHPSHDKFWKSFYFTPEEGRKIDIPILSITGHFDSDQPGALKYYKDHMDYGNKETIKSHYLIVGPWNHGGTRRPKKQLGGLTFKENAVLDMNQLYLDWFNWTLNKGEKPVLLKDRVMYYVMSKNEWEYVSDINMISNNEMELYLSSPNTDANDVFSSGKLLSKPEKDDNESDDIIFNPLDNKATTFASYKSENPKYYMDQAYLNDSNILVYHSKPISDAVEVNGKIKFEAYISMNVVDADFQVTIYEVTKNNESIFLQTDQLRARYRNSLEKSELVTKGKIEKYSFEGENLFSRKLQKGSRIRLVFSSIDSPNTQKNYNIAEDPSKQLAKNAKTAHIKLFHNTKYPSKIVLPIKK